MERLLPRERSQAAASPATICSTITMTHRLIPGRSLPYQRFSVMAASSEIVLPVNCAMSLRAPALSSGTEYLTISVKLAVLDRSLRGETGNNHGTESGAFVPQNGLTLAGFARTVQELFE